MTQIVSYKQLTTDRAPNSNSLYAVLSLVTAALAVVLSVSTVCTVQCAAMVITVAAASSDLHFLWCG